MADITEIKRRLDGRYEERFDRHWVAEFEEDPNSGFWSVQLFLDDASEWESFDYTSLEDAAAAAQAYVSQRS